MSTDTCTCIAGQTCPGCAELLNLVAAMVKPIPPDNTRAMAVLAALRQGLMAA